MILADTLRDRIDDVTLDMEQQFAGIAPSLEGLIDEALKGDRSAAQQLQAIGRTLVAPMIDQYGLAAGALAADWYDLNRELAELGGSWSGARIQDPNVDTGPLVGGVLAQFVSASSVLSELQAGMDLRVRQAANGTVMDSVLRDPKARGWGRVASAGCCDYCALLAGRGAVYRSQFTATFCPHLHCQCQAIPVWGGDAVSLRSREDTVATRRRFSSDSEKDKAIRARQNAQARQWIEDNRSTLGLLP